jgi:hypothetical protein
MKGYRRIHAALSLVAALAFAAPAFAGDSGVRVGMSVQPDQFYFGAHTQIGEVVPKVWFRPNAELGIGGGDSVLGLNAEFAYYPGRRNRIWRPYLGVGPGLNIFFERQQELHASLNFLAGLQHRDGFFTEMKVGAFDGPQLKIGAGYSFR